MTQSSILHLLLRRKRLLLLSGVATAAIVFGFSRTLPHQYTSEGSLIVDNHANPGELTNPSVLNGVLTQIDVLQSSGLIRQVVLDLNLAHAPGLIPTMRLPEPVMQSLNAASQYIAAAIHSVLGTKADSVSETDRLVTYVQKHLSATAQDSSSVISVRFEAGSPEVAAAVVNAIMTQYMTTISATRDSGVAKIDTWIHKQLAQHQADVDAAELRVNQFLQAHNNLSEVQGSLTAAIQLSKDQDQLVLAHEDLAQKQAAYDTVTHGGNISGALESLESKNIQDLRDMENKTQGLIGTLTTLDPRRGPLQSELASIRAQIGNEHGLILASLGRAVQIARAHVQALETSVHNEIDVAQASTVAGVTLKQLTGDLDAKRQFQVSFLTQAGQARIAAEQEPIAHVLFAGHEPERPIPAAGLMALVLGFLGGSVGAAGTVLWRSIASLKINSAEEMLLATGRPVFGSLPDIRLATSGQRFLKSPYSAPLVTETFRSMWVTMRDQKGKDGSIILVTSSDTEEGKTTIAASLAHRYADDGFRVLLIDGDLRKPRLSLALDQNPRKCLEFALDGIPLEQSVMNIKPGLDCLLTNGTADNPLKVLSSEAFRWLMTTCRERYDFVIVDSPPVLQVADPVVMAKLAQHIVFVVQAGKVPNRLVAEAIHRFSEEDSVKLMVLLTRVKRSLMDATSYYGGYETPRQRSIAAS